MTRSLVIATEAAAATGLGHFVRTSALAQVASERGWRVRYLLRPNAVDFARSQVRDRGWELLESPWQVGSAEMIDQVAGSVVVVDSYLPDPADDGWRAMQEAAGLVVLMNDGEPAPAAVDVIVNQNLTADASFYPQHRARLLLGTDFALLRADFASRRAEALELAGRLPSMPRRVLVVLGGTDVSDSTHVLARAAASVFADAEIVAISAALPEGRDALLPTIEYRRPTTDIASLMLSADLVLSAGGTTIWELGCLARPTAVLQVADNQAPVYDLLVAQHAVLGLGTPPVALEDAASVLAGAVGRLGELAGRLAPLADGRGCERVLDAVDEVLALRR